MTRVTASTRRFAVRQAIRQMAVEGAAARASAARESAAGAPPPMRAPDPIETPLSPDEVEQGVRDGTFRAPAEFEPRQRDMQAGPDARYVTKGTL